MKTVWRLYWVQPGYAMKMQEFPSTKENLQSFLDLMKVPREAWASPQHGGYVTPAFVLAWAEENKIPLHQSDTVLTTQGSPADVDLDIVAQAIKALAKGSNAALDSVLDSISERLECQGHESLDGAHMGETVYCNGTCR